MQGSEPINPVNGNPSSTSNNEAPFNTLERTLEQFQELDQLKDQFVNIPIPLELLDYLDQCKNPQLYTKECMQRTLQKNKEVNGKIEMYKKFYASLLAELASEMPQDTITYLNMRKPDGHDSGTKMTTIFSMAPKNGHTAPLIRFCDTLRVLKVSWTANSLKSEGMEQFMDEYLPIIRENNPQIRYLINRTYLESDPWVVGQYVWNRTRSRRMCWKNKNQVLAFVEELSLGGSYWESKRVRVSNAVPRGWQIRNSETLGHDIYKVLSKYKGDPEDPYEIPINQHPNYVRVGRISKQKMLYFKKIEEEAEARRKAEYKAEDD